MQALTRQVTGRRVGLDAGDPYAEHRALIAAEARRLGYLFTHRQLLVVLAHVAQRPVLGRAVQSGEVALECAEGLDHALAPYR